MLTTLERRSIVAFVRTVINEEDAQQKIATYCELIGRETWKEGVAFGIAYYNKEIAKRDKKSGKDFLQDYANAKRINEEELCDKGAFGDLYECLIRCAIIGNINLFHIDHVHAKKSETSDCVYKGHIVEIGHNGKTWQEATYEDYMSGKFESVIYGVFDKEDKEAIYDLIDNGDIKTAIEYALTNSGYWQNKYDFYNDITALGRGKAITVKSNKVMSQYSKSRHDMFLMGIENGKIPAATDYFHIK